MRRVIVQALSFPANVRIRDSVACAAYTSTGVRHVAREQQCESDALFLREAGAEITHSPALRDSALTAAGDLVVQARISPMLRMATGPWNVSTRRRDYRPVLGRGRG